MARKEVEVDKKKKKNVKKKLGQIEQVLNF